VILILASIIFNGAVAFCAAGFRIWYRCVPHPAVKQYDQGAENHTSGNFPRFHSVPRVACHSLSFKSQRTTLEFLKQLSYNFKTKYFFRTVCSMTVAEVGKIYRITYQRSGSTQRSALCRVFPTLLNF